MRLVSDLVDVSRDCGDLRLDPVDEFCHDCIGFKNYGLQIVAVPAIQIEEFKPYTVGGRGRGVVRILRGLGTDVAVLASVRTVRVGHR